MIATKDLIIPPTTLRMMAKRAGGKVTQIAGNHAVMLSHPRDVADFMEEPPLQCDPESAFEAP